MIQDRVLIGKSDTETYWIATLAGAGVDAATDVAYDSSGNVYICGTSDNNNNKAIIAKYNSSGVIQWQRVFGSTTSDNILGNGVAVDSDANVYICVYYGPNTSIIIAKYNSSGVIQWQREFDSTSLNRAYDIAVDGSGNVYITGYSYPSSNARVLTAKYDTSGNLQWQKAVDATNTDIGYAVDVDANANVYVCGLYSDVISTAEDILVLKYNTSGTLQWQRTLTSVLVDTGYGIAVSSAGNVYVCGQGGPDNSFVIAKYNTSGTIQWQRYLNSTSADVARGIALDDNENVYVCGYSSVGTTSDNIYIVKYNSSGTLQWQRSLGSTGADIAYRIAVKGTKLCISGAVNVSNQQMLIAQLPTDGSLTGTYTVGGISLTYAASSLTNATGGMTSTTTTMSSLTPSLTSSTSTIAETAATLTSSVTTL